MTAPARRQAAARSVLAGEPVRDKGSRRAELVVDETDTYVFDHELDHVPGMLAIEGLAQLVGAGPDQNGTGDAVTFVRELAVDFLCFAEKGRTTTLTATPADADAIRWLVAADQAGTRICAGEMTIGRAAVPAAAPAPGAEMADRLLVHKRHEGNVLVGPLLTGPDGFRADLRSPAPDHALHDPRLRHMIELVDAARQFGIMAVHVAQGVPLDRQFIFQSVTASLDTPVARHTRAYLTTWVHPQRPTVLRDTVELRHDGVVAGRFTFTFRTTTATGYRWLRAKRVGGT
jgi:hypothetical protein